MASSSSHDVPDSSPRQRQLVHVVSDPPSVASTTVDVFSDTDSVDSAGGPPVANDTFAEIYSPPRIAPLVAAREGHTAHLSIDYLPGFCHAGDTACNLALSADRHWVMKQLKVKRPRLCVVCPPCTQHR